MHDIESHALMVVLVSIKVLRHCELKWCPPPKKKTTTTTPPPLQKKKKKKPKNPNNPYGAKMCYGWQMIDTFWNHMITDTIVVNERPLCLHCLRIRYIATFNIYVIDGRAAGAAHDDVIKWKHFPRNWPFLRGIYRPPVNSPHKGQWRGALMFALICVWINGWVNNREAGDLRRYRAHSGVTKMEMNWFRSG